MKLRKLALVLVIVLMASAFTTAFAKNPFADVPADHWAYDSVVELAAAGLVEGYPDGTFGGARMMTRYEAAMVFARALHRLEAQIGETNVLPELDKIKAELKEEIKAQMAALNAPVVETTIVQEIDEETLARIRAAEIATEALEGDLAYLEARVLGLVDGIRYDVNKVQGQVAGLEQPSMEEIEALIAAKIQEGLLEAALSAKEVVKETTIVERVVSETPELTEEDVEAIAEALIVKQLQKYDILVRENREFIIGLFDRVDEMDARITDLEKVKLSGSYKFEAKSKYDAKDDQDNDIVVDEWQFKQTGDLSVNIKASETTNVKAFLGFDVNSGTLANDKLTNYGLEVTSETPVNRLVVGKVDKDDIGARFGNYTLKKDQDGKHIYAFAGLADLQIIPGLTGNVLLAQREISAASPVTAALALSYEFIPELGLKAAFVAEKLSAANPKAKAVGAGIFGTVANINYTGDFAMDFGADDKNMLFAAKADTEIADFELDAAFTMAQENYDITNPFIAAGTKYSFELGAGFDGLLGIELGGRYYHEAADAREIGAFKVDAKKGFDLIVPVTLSATYVNNSTKGLDAKQHTLAKLAVGPAEEPKLGFHYGASAAYVKNELKKDGNWKNTAHIYNTDAAIFDANVKYKLDWNGAIVSLGYGANFKMPTQPKDQSNVLTHKVDLGYDFTENVKLTLGGTVEQVLANPVENDFIYKAGLSVNF